MAQYLFGLVSIFESHVLKNFIEHVNKSFVEGIYLLDAIICFAEKHGQNDM